MDQYNCLQGKLLEHFTDLKAHHSFNLLHLACRQTSKEDRGPVQYLQDCASEDSLTNDLIYGRDSPRRERPLTTLQDWLIGNLFKVYP
jgi:glutathionylspermidine synthase